MINSTIIDQSKSIAKQVIQHLFENNLQSVIIEGGSNALQSFIDENLWDEARIFIGQTKFESGIRAPKIEGKIVEKKNILNDELVIFTPYD